MKCWKKDKIAYGSLTVECAIVLPLFMFFILSVIYLTGLFRAESIVETGMIQKCEFAARDAYATETIAGGVGGAADSLISTVTAKSFMTDKAGSSYFEKSGIENGLAGVICLADGLTNKNRIALTAAYKYHVPFNIFGLSDFYVFQRAVSRKWTGYDITEETDDEEIVYVAEHGSVYHKSPNCTHIQLDIRAVSSESVGSLRNEDGCKYYDCEKCMKSKNRPSTVYITPWGNCVHSSVNCSGLKRTVRAVPKSKCGGLGPCSKCGGY